jgi:RNA polymerase sigma-70 factor (ECF subfamily)
MSHNEELDQAVIAERRKLVSLAFRMLGTVAEAEDAVQETYTRWYRLSDDERAVIENPAAWLTRVASRICLDVLGSARARHERYVGPWLPEPVPPTAFADAAPLDPLDQVTLDDSVSSALLVVLESMTPAERVAFVLHDVFALPFGEIAEVVGRSPAACRQLATSARRRIAAAPMRTVTRAEHEAAVMAFAAATAAGDLNALVAALDPGVVLRSDGGGRVSSALKPIIGADRVARFVLGVAQKRPDAVVLPQPTHDGLGFAIWEDGIIIGVLTLDVLDSRITALRMVMNPDKLTLWNSVELTTSADPR